MWTITNPPLEMTDSNMPTARIADVAGEELEAARLQLIPWQCRNDHMVHIHDGGQTTDRGVGQRHPRRGERAEAGFIQVPSSGLLRASRWYFTLPELRQLCRGKMLLGKTWSSAVNQTTSGPASCGIPHN